MQPISSCERLARFVARKAAASAILRMLPPVKGCLLRPNCLANYAAIFFVWERELNNKPDAPGEGLIEVLPQIGETES
jgi:hypothetical protein